SQNRLVIYTHIFQRSFGVGCLRLQYRLYNSCRIVCHQNKRVHPSLPIWTSAYRQLTWQLFLHHIPITSLCFYSKSQFVYDSFFPYKIDESMALLQLGSPGLASFSVLFRVSILRRPFYMILSSVLFLPFEAIGNVFCILLFLDR